MTALLKFALVSLGLFVSCVSGGDVPEGGSCDSDSDCVGNYDCIRTGFFRKNCFAVSCAKGAAHALIESGFDGQKYLSDIREGSGFRRRDFIGGGGNNQKQLAQAFRDNPWPRQTFMSNYTACIHPNNPARQRELQDYSSTWLGVQWGVAAVGAYCGKSTWSEETLGVVAQIVSNCVGGILGADVGVDFLIQVFNDGDGLHKLFPQMVEGETEQGITVEFELSDIQCVPIFWLPVLGLQVCWFEELGPDQLTMTEVSLGGSVGAGLGAFLQCFNQGFLIS